MFLSNISWKINCVKKDKSRKKWLDWYQKEVVVWYHATLKCFFNSGMGVITTAPEMNSSICRIVLMMTHNPGPKPLGFCSEVRPAPRLIPSCLPIWSSSSAWDSTRPKTPRMVGEGIDMDIPDRGSVGCVSLGRRGRGMLGGAPGSGLLELARRGRKVSKSDVEADLLSWLRRLVGGGWIGKSFVKPEPEANVDLVPKFDGGKSSSS